MYSQAEALSLTRSRGTIVRIMAPKGPLVVHRVLSHYMQWCITEGTGKTGKTVRTVGS